MLALPLAGYLISRPGPGVSTAFLVLVFLSSVLVRQMYLVVAGLSRLDLWYGWYGWRWVFELTFSTLLLLILFGLVVRGQGGRVRRKYGVLAAFSAVVIFASFSLMGAQMFSGISAKPPRLRHDTVVLLEKSYPLRPEVVETLVIPNLNLSTEFPHHELIQLTVEKHYGGLNWIKMMDTEGHVVEEGTGLGPGGSISTYAMDMSGWVIELYSRESTTLNLTIIACLRYPTGQ